MSDPIDKKKVRGLIETALAAAHEEGMEFVAEQEGCSWSQQTHEEKERLAEEARQALYAALGIKPELPVFDKTDDGTGNVVGKAVMNDDGTATITLDDSPEAQAIYDKIKSPPGFGISSKGGKA